MDLIQDELWKTTQTSVDPLPAVVLTFSQPIRDEVVARSQTIPFDFSISHSVARATSNGVHEINSSLATALAAVQVATRLSAQGSHSGIWLARSMESISKAASFVRSLTVMGADLEMHQREYDAHRILRIAFNLVQPEAAVRNIPLRIARKSKEVRIRQDPRAVMSIMLSTLFAAVDLQPFKIVFGVQPRNGADIIVKAIRCGIDPCLALKELRRSLRTSLKTLEAKIYCRVTKEQDLRIRIVLPTHAGVDA